MAGPIHWNIRGLKVTNFEKVKKCCAMLERVHEILFLNIQETHLNDDTQIPNKLLNFSHLYSIISSHAEDNDKGAGILLFVNKTEEVIEKKVLFPGRLLFVKIKNKSSGQERNIFSFYAKSHAHSDEVKGYMSAIQDKIVNDSMNGIIITGDFNFVTSLLDRNSGAYTATDNMYRHEWQKLEINLGLMDAFRITNPKRRLYSYTHTNGTSRSRIDRIYISPDLQGKVLSSAFENVFCSDHKITKLNFAQDIDTGPGQWIFNNTLLGDQNFVEGIKDIISDYNLHKNTFLDAKELWEILKQNFSSYSKNYSRQNARNQRKEYNLLKEKIDVLESIPKEEVCEGVVNALANLKSQEKVYLEKKLEGSILRAKAPHIEPNEKDISYYARLEKISGEKNQIYCLQDSQNRLKQGTENVKKIVYDFYSNLYTKEAECNVTQDFFLNKVNVRLSDEDRNELDKDLSIQEISKSMSSLQNRKSPGSDGLTKEFYDYFWPDLKDLYFDCLKECKLSKKLTDSQKRGLIRISYKKNGRIWIKNYRPITLLNVDLKILTRTLAMRVAKVLPKLIHRNQTCVPGRNISTNIHIIQDLIDVINSDGEGAAFIFLDQEKAFDRMSHSFILKTLRRFGFGENFINWIKIIYTDVTSSVKVNGYLTKEFSIERGVRQGCPLSALLYVLCAEVLAIEIRLNKNIVGYKYNGGRNEHKINLFADDNAVCVTTKNSVLELFTVLGKYEAATNARINKDKTEGLWVGNFRGEDMNFAGIKWVDGPVKSLGDM